MHTSAAQIRDAMHELLTAWNDVQPHWNDGVSRRFCETYLEPLAPLVKLSLDSIANTARMIDQMHRECDS
jgi:hypothetical protein